MPLFQKSTVTFGTAKTLVAQQASKQNTNEFKTRAGQSLQAAIRYWNKYNWRWLMKQSPTITTTTGASAVALPHDFKDVYSLRVVSTGMERVLVANSKRTFDRHLSDPDTPDITKGYNLFSQGDQGMLGLVPPTNAAINLAMRYYRRMTVPCSAIVTGVVPALAASSVNVSSLNVSSLAGMTWSCPLTLPSGWTLESGFTRAVGLPYSPDYFIVSGAIFNTTAVATASATYSCGGDEHPLDIPEDYENGILSWATHHFLSTLGAPQGRLTYYVQLANDELEEAKRVNEQFEDQDIGFDLGFPVDTISPNSTRRDF